MNKTGAILRVSLAQEPQKEQIHFRKKLKNVYSIYILYTANQSYFTCRHGAAEGIKSILVFKKEIKVRKREKHTQIL